MRVNICSIVLLSTNSMINYHWKHTRPTSTGKGVFHTALCVRGSEYLTVHRLSGGNQFKISMITASFFLKACSK